MGTGALNLNFPTGGCANASPNQCSVPLDARTPLNVPVFKLTTKELDCACARKAANRGRSNNQRLAKNISLHLKPARRRHFSWIAKCPVFMYSCYSFLPHERGVIARNFFTRA